MKLGFPDFRHFLGVIAALVVLSAVIQPTAAQTTHTGSLWDVDQSTVKTSDTDQPIMVGGTELTWSGDWEYSLPLDEDIQAMLIKELDSGSAVVATYGVFPNDYAVDAEAAMQTLFDPMEEGEGVEQSGSGELESGGIWKAYTLEDPDGRFSLVITVSQTASGEFVISTLLTETDNLGQNIIVAQEEIMLNGEPTFLEGIDPAEVTVNLSPAVEPTSDPESTVESTSELEPTAADQPIMVGGTELTWTGDWVYGFDEDVQAMLSKESGPGTVLVVTYGVFDDDYGVDAESVMQALHHEVVRDDAARESGSGEIEGGGIWKLYHYQTSIEVDDEDLYVSLVITVSQAASGEFVISALLTETDNLGQNIIVAQEEIMLNGEPTFLEGIDPAEVTANLGDRASPVASPEATPAS